MEKRIYKEKKTFLKNSKTALRVFAVSMLCVLGSSMTFVNKDVQALDTTIYTDNIEIVCNATAYTGGGYTATGRECLRDPEGLSTISVDPSVIPLGSIVYVEGYGYAVAADTGGAIKGNIIDVYFNSLGECYDWGRKDVRVTVIANHG